MLLPLRCKLKRLAILFCLGTGLLPSSSVANEPSNTVDPTPCADYGCAGYAFARQIQSAIERRDLQLLYSFVAAAPGFSGPRPAYVAGKSFRDVFPDAWRKQVLDSTADKVGARGWELGNGLIWFESLGEGWVIMAINGGIEESPPVPGSDRWEMGGQRLTNACFSYPWLSGDNYEHFRDTYAPQVDWDEFVQHIGRYIGTPIPLQPIASPWSGYLDEDVLWLSANVAQCVAGTADDGSRYQVLATLKGDCSPYAPQVPGLCKEAKLLLIRPRCEGTVCPPTAAMYGVFQLAPSAAGQWVVPLRNFGSKNQALDFLDSTQQGVLAHGWLEQRLQRTNHRSGQHHVQWRRGGRQSDQLFLHRQPTFIPDRRDPFPELQSVQPD